MKQLISSRAARPLVALVAIALGACSDRSTVTQAPPKDPNRLIICCGGGGGGGGDDDPPPPPPVAISSLSLPDNTLPIGGELRSYGATLTNDGSSLSGVMVRGYVVQGTTRRAAGEMQINCGAGTGVLPSGTCTITGSIPTSNDASGNGWLVTGIATFELNLIVAGSFTAIKTYGVNLVPAVFSAIGPNMLSLSGAVNGLSASMHGGGGAQTVGSLSFEATVIQGAARRAAGASPLTCPGAGWGNLPPSASCTTSLGLVLKNTNSGSGTLVPGPATLQVALLKGTTVLAIKTWPMTVVDVRYTAAAVTSSPAYLGGIHPFTATIANTGMSLSPVTLRTFIRQGTTTAGFSTTVINCGSGDGVLPNGTCTISGTYSTMKDGTGTLVPGPATLELPLRLNFVVLDSIRVPITLSLGPTIDTVTPPSSVIIGTPGPLLTYTATANNPVASFSNVSLTARIIQGVANRSAFPGSTSVDCGSGAGVLPSGGCTFTGYFLASNTAEGTGTLQPGTATLEIRVVDPTNGVLTIKQVPITLRF